MNSMAYYIEINCSLKLAQQILSLKKTRGICTVQVLGLAYCLGCLIGLWHFQLVWCVLHPIALHFKLCFLYTVFVDLFGTCYFTLGEVYKF